MLFFIIPLSGAPVVRWVLLFCRFLCYYCNNTKDVEA
uniref:Ryanodine Receptor, Peptidyl-prolyl cis-trans isomerase Release Channel, Ryanodine Receptor.5A n=1 Tax=Myoviridae sp. ctMvU7 TaxID=2826642 RepID=A0A8S5M7F4_9CAUD|nr:MAG TPA: Ryanodine Receptor, Peptidyl-prolyl cis-trans isomerase Release Channel, Ryanodine Receptor.5A [Myoviridae sp. ctMvU7]